MAAVRQSGHRCELRHYSKVIIVITFEIRTSEMKEAVTPSFPGNLGTPISKMNEIMSLRHQNVNPDFCVNMLISLLNVIISVGTTLSNHREHDLKFSSGEYQVNLPICSDQPVKQHCINNGSFTRLKLTPSRRICFLQSTFYIDAGDWSNSRYSLIPWYCITSYMNLDQVDPGPDDVSVALIFLRFK